MHVLGLNSNHFLYLSIRKFYWKIATDRLLPFRSFSTYGEDAILRIYLPERRGSYLDVGAGEPKGSSNTFFLYRRGWHGIAIDPLKRNEKLFKKHRSRDHFIRGVVSNVGVSIPVYEYRDYQFSHSSEELKSSLQNAGISPITVEFHVPMKIADLELNVGPESAFVLTIDVESHEMAVLETIDWDQFRPRVICVEEWNFNAEKTTDICRFLTAKSYILMSRAVTSNIYVHSEYSGKIISATQSHLN